MPKRIIDEEEIELGEGKTVLAGFSKQGLETLTFLDDDEAQFVMDGGQTARLTQWLEALDQDYDDDDDDDDDDDGPMIVYGG